MEIGLIAAPIIGAVIGYFTNYIAVKMLFRPYNEKKIGGFVIPFTPGIIPKGKPRLAKAISNTIGDTLLTEEDLKNTLLKEEVKEAVRQKCHEKIEEIKARPKTVIDFVKEEGLVANPQELMSEVEAKIVSKVMNKLLVLDLGTLAAEKIIEVGSEFLQGSFIGSFIGPNVLNQFREPIKTKVDELVRTEGYEMIKAGVHDEMTSACNVSLNQAFEGAKSFNLDFEDIAVTLYERIVKSGLSDLLEKVNIKKIIEDKVNAMDPKELEELTFAVMKKELNAIINLGALIGFLLGCINIIFLR